jgi:hypothetical protein
MQSKASHPVSLRPILMLSSHLRLGLPSGLFPSDSLTKNFVCISDLCHASYMPLPSHPPWLAHPNNIWWSVQVMKLLIMKSQSPALCDTVVYSKLHLPWTQKFKTVVSKIDKSCLFVSSDVGQNAMGMRHWHRDEFRVYATPGIPTLRVTGNRFLEKLIVAQQVGKLPAFCGTRRFITLSTKATFWSLS